MRHPERPHKRPHITVSHNRIYASYARITHLLLYAYRLFPPSLHQYPTYKRKASGKAGWIGFYKSRYERLRKLPVRMVHEMNCHIPPQHMTRSYQALLNCRFTAKIFNSVRWVNRPTSMINTAVAITQQRMNQFKLVAPFATDATDKINSVV